MNVAIRIAGRERLRMDIPEEKFDRAVDVILAHMPGLLRDGSVAVTVYSDNIIYLRQRRAA